MRGAVALLVIIAALRLVVAATTGIVDDEAYYWVWSTKLAAGYYDHPPAIAWFIAASANLFGATSLGVRGACVLAGTGCAALLLKHTPRPALFAFLVGVTPLYTLGGVLATPDIPLLCGWALALRGALDGRWWLAGLGAGIAGLGKYTGFGLWPLLVLATPREWRKMLPAMGLTLLVLSPNLVWNAQHDWVSIRFQLNHGLASRPAGALAFFGAQVGLVSPILFVTMGVFGIFARWGSREDRILWWTCIPVVAFFTFAATRGSGEANWAAPAYLSGLLALTRGGPRLTRAAAAGGGLALLLSGLVVLHLYTPLVDLPKDPTARLGLGRDLAMSVQAWGAEPVYTSRYQEAALIRYYAGIDAVALPGVDRLDQYDLWPTPWADHALFVRPYKTGAALAADPFCADHGPANVVTEHDIDGAVLDRWQVYEVRGCHAP